LRAIPRQVDRGQQARPGTRGVGRLLPVSRPGDNVCFHGDHRASYGHKEVLMSESTASTSATAARPGAHRAYIVLLLAFLLDGVLQITLAGFGAFDLDGRKLGAKGNDAFAAHAMNGLLMSVLALAILVLALVAKEGGRTVGLAVLLLVLTAVVQSVLSGLGDDTPFFGALHALDGVALLGLAGFLHGSATRASRG
jgi:Family of unknown function (DUF6220)